MIAHRLKLKKACVALTCVSMFFSSVPVPLQTVSISSDSSCLAPVIARSNPAKAEYNSDIEKEFSSYVLSLLTTPLESTGDAEKDALLRKNGYGQPGYGVSVGAAINGSFAVEGDQGYFADGGKEKFLAVFDAMRAFFEKGDMEVVRKIGIGGQHTAFQGLSDAFDKVMGEEGISISGEYEIGTDFWKKLISEFKALGIAPQDIPLPLLMKLILQKLGIIISSKSGSTDESMTIFVNFLRLMLTAAAIQSGYEIEAAEAVALSVLESMHIANFDDRTEKKVLFDRKLVLQDVDFAGKKVLMRVDFNVPLDADGKITDDTRIFAALDTIKYITERGGKVVLMSHLGRPNGKVNPSMSLAPAAQRLSELLDQNVPLAPDCVGEEAAKMAADMNAGDVILLENLRFHAGEEHNDPGFAAQLAALVGEDGIYVNDAFGTAHRAHASTAGVAQYMNVAVPGFLMEKEIKFLGDALAQPQRPLVAVLGGAKTKTKIPVIRQLSMIADEIILTGGIAYTFLAAMGVDVGDSMVDEDSFEFARQMLAESGKNGRAKIILPDDFLASKEFGKTDTKMTTPGQEIGAGYIAQDIGPRSEAKFAQVIAKAGTVFWNGPVGVFEVDGFDHGTNAIAQAMADTDVVTIVGGGDSVAAVNKAGLGSRMTHISTGGGASLEYIERGTLPGIEVLSKGFIINETVKQATAKGIKLSHKQVIEIMGDALKNMFFETTDVPAESRLSAFIRNSGLSEILGSKAPGFGAMFENVGGRWTGDLHMLTFLAAYGLDAQAYWQARRDGVEKARNEEHRGVKIGDKIADEGITDIAFVVPDTLFWAGKSEEQNFNESIWQKGYANLVTVRASRWQYQKHNYLKTRKDRKTMVINLAGLDMDPKLFNSVNLQRFDLNHNDPQKLAMDFAEFFNTFYSMTNRVGTRLIARALAEAGFSVEALKNDPTFNMNNLEHPAVKIIQRNLFVLQFFVELGKGIVKTRLELLQSAENPDEAIKSAEELVYDHSRRMKYLTSGVSPEGQQETYLREDTTAPVDVESIVQRVIEAAEVAKRLGRKFSIFPYKEGKAYQAFCDLLVKKGYEWMLQGTGDQHISYNQVLEQPSKSFIFFISFTPEVMLPGDPAVGFAKGYLHNISPHLERHFFGEASFEALLSQGGVGCFLNVQDTPEMMETMGRVFQTVGNKMTSAMSRSEGVREIIESSMKDKPYLTVDEALYDLHLAGAPYPENKYALDALKIEYSLETETSLIGKILHNPAMLELISPERVSLLITYMNKHEGEMKIPDISVTGSEIGKGIESNDNPILAHLFFHTFVLTQTNNDNLVSSAELVRRILKEHLADYSEKSRELLTGIIDKLVAIGKRVDDGVAEIDGDIARVYDFRTKLAHVRGGDMIEEAGFFMGIAIADMALARAEKLGLESRTFTLGRDGRKKNDRFLDAMRDALVFKGLNVVYVANDSNGNDQPMSVSSYSAAVRLKYYNPKTDRMEKPIGSAFNTASHVSVELATIEDTIEEKVEKAMGKATIAKKQKATEKKTKKMDRVCGAKVIMAENKDGTLVSITSANNQEIKAEMFRMVNDPAVFRTAESGDIGTYGTCADIPEIFLAEDKAIIATMAVGGTQDILEEGDAQNYTLAELDRQLVEAERVNDDGTDIRNVIHSEGWQKVTQMGNTCLDGVNFVIDPVHTVSGVQAVNVLEGLGAQCVGHVNLDVQEISGKHAADPSKDVNLANLDKLITDNGAAHFGMAFDLDGDRIAIRYKTKEGRMATMPPDVLMTLLLPLLIERGGYDVSTFAVIRDVLGTEMIDLTAEGLGVKAYQTDAGYVFLKALKRELELNAKEGEKKTVVLYGESSGHGWLHAAGDIENPIALAGLFSIMVKEYQSKHPELANNEVVADLLDKSLKYKTTYSGRFTPNFHRGFLKRILKEWFSGLPQDRKEYLGIQDWSMKTLEDVPVAVVDEGRHMALEIMRTDFAPGTVFESPIGQIRVRSIYVDVDSNGRNKYADVKFEMAADGTYAGRFQLRASTNDPNFVCGYEVPQFGLEKQNFSSDALFYSLGGVILDWMDSNEISPTSEGYSALKNVFLTETYTVYNIVKSA